MGVFDLEEATLTEILVKMRSASLEVRLETIREAQNLKNNIFAKCETIDDWVKAALIVEQLYALMCEALKQPTKRIKLEKAEDTEEVEKPIKKQTPAKPKQKVKVARTDVDFEAIRQGFLALLKEKEKQNEGEKTS
jgi:hypothetical protein